LPTSNAPAIAAPSERFWNDCVELSSREGRVPRDGHSFGHAPAAGLIEQLPEVACPFAEALTNIVFAGLNGGLEVFR
jgi:hypothetical protein